MRDEHDNMITIEGEGLGDILTWLGRAGKKVVEWFKKLSSAQRRAQQPRLLEAIRSVVVKFTPDLTTALKKYGDQPIERIYITRAPTSQGMLKFLNVVSLGKFFKAIKESNYDDIFHLGIYINDELYFEKVHKVVLAKRPIPEDAEVISVRLPKAFKGKVTIRDFIKLTYHYMGRDNFIKYNARTRNCQDFVIGALEANGLGSKSVFNWIKQDAESIMRKAGKHVDTVAELVTKVARTLSTKDEYKGDGLRRRKNKSSKCKIKPSCPLRKKLNQ